MSSSLEGELRHSVEIVQGRLYYCPLQTAPGPASSGSGNRHMFSIDSELVYWNFYLDFGPLNLGHLYRFCRLLNAKLNDVKLKDKQIIFYSSTHPHKRTNAVYLITSWSLLYNGKTPEEAFAPFKPVAHTFPSWHDATPSVCSFNLTILDTLRGLNKARECKFFDFDNFDINDYEFFEQVENGDMNWYVHGKFIAFAGPHSRESAPKGFHSLPPEHYVPHFKQKGVTCVIRLNKRYYDARSFTTQGIDHLDLYFEDGSNPPDHILYKFIAKCEEHRGAIAVHCKAGLGRTGSCIAAYVMKHFKFTAEEIIGWMRICRPGSIIGPQQQYMKELQGRMWKEGDEMRAKLAASSPTRQLDGGYSPVGGGSVTPVNSPLVSRKDVEDKVGGGGLIGSGSTGGGREDPSVMHLRQQTSALSINNNSGGIRHVGSNGTINSPVDSSFSSGGSGGSIGSQVDQKEAQGDQLRLQRVRLQQQQLLQQQQQQQRGSATSSTDRFKRDI